MMLDNNRHFYLYAKHHYKETDTMDDLKVLLANYCGTDKCYLNNRDVMRKLVDLVSEHLSKPRFCTFIENLMYPLTSTDIHEHICLELLRILRFLTVNEIPIALGKPNPELLALGCGTPSEKE